MDPLQFLHGHSPETSHHLHSTTQTPFPQTSYNFSCQNPEGSFHSPFPKKTSHLASDRSNVPPSESPPEEIEQKFDPRRLQEKFAVLNTGIYECRSCGYKYDEAVGDPSCPIPPGYQFDRLLDDWRCPTCGAAHSFFESKRVEIACFAHNQQHGFGGGNALTSGQKAILIYDN